MTKSKTPREQFDEGFWNDNAAPVIREEPSDSRVYDLEERTARFGEAVIDFAKTIPQNALTNRIISQLVAAATSVGANYVEADDAVSKKEFLKSIGTCKNEVREAKHFLRMAVCAVPKLKSEAQTLAGSARIASDFRENLAERKTMNEDVSITNSQGMPFVIRASSLVRHSSFVIFPIRHSNHAH